MKKSVLIIFFILILSACSTKAPLATATVFPTQTQTIFQFMDEALPDATPQRFGEDFFRGSFHSAPVFSPDGKTAWWAGEYSTAIIYISQNNSGTWSPTIPVRFSESISTYRDPFISPDGKKFYFISTAPVSDSSSGGKENIWMMDKKEEGWSEPYPLPESINSLDLHWTISVDDNYNLYFSAKNNGKPDIFLSRYTNDNYSTPAALDAPINTDEMEITPNIAADGSYLLFSRLKGTTDIPHLFISYVLDSGWSEPVKVENIPYCISPIVTPDRRFVIFLSSPSSFAWRDTSFVDELRPQ